ncbi:MAG: DNRLRE domain-containing protein [Chloroflexi bacterium]|jgi:hypothetical protein|nr:DNRLRE domain-containing protein [Chloroflexota bacterium]
MTVRRNGVRTSLVRFNLSSVPSGLTVTEARVELYCVARSNPGPLTISVHRAIRWWGEGRANWTVAAKGLLWGVPGCKQYGVDLGRRVLSSVDATATGQWYSWDITGQVQSWLGGARNHGLVFVGSGPASVEYQFLTSESTWNAPRTPRLVIKYQP